LNSVGLVEFPYRLEFQNHFAIHDEVRPDVTDILSFIKDGNDPFSFVIDAELAKSDFESAMIDGLGVSRTE
jgi:hypothetical protein